MSDLHSPTPLDDRFVDADVGTGAAGGDVPVLEPGGGGQHKVGVLGCPGIERIGGHDEIDGGEHLVDHLVGIGALVDEVRGGDVEEVDWARDRP